MLETDRIVRLVRLALDEFDDRPLEVNVRRTIRIASLMGDSKTAIRLAFELKPIGGRPEANAEDTRRLMSDPSEWHSRSGPHEAAIAEYSDDRRLSNGKVLAHSLPELEFWEGVYKELDHGASQGTKEEN